MLLELQNVIVFGFFTPLLHFIGDSYDTILSLVLLISESMN